MTAAEQLLARIAASPGVARRLRDIREDAGLVEFDHVHPAGQGLLAATIAQAVKRRLWLVCATSREQELLHAELSAWFPEALFFPEMECARPENAAPDPETQAERLAVLQLLADARKRGVVVLSQSSLAESVPALDQLKSTSVRLTRGKRLDRAKLIAQLEAAGYEAAPQVAMRGQFAVRGGILDIFSWQQMQPVRIELFGDDIESVRQFDLDAQTSVEPLNSCTIQLGDALTGGQRIADYFRKGDVLVGVAAEFPEANVIIREDASGAEAVEDFSTAFLPHGLSDFDPGELVIAEARRDMLFGQLEDWRAAGWTVFLFCNNEGELERLREFLTEELRDDPRLLLATGGLTRGFVMEAARVAVVSDAELFGRYRHNRARRLSLRRARELANRSPIDFSELTDGDYVVHLEHGIARFDGLRRLPAGLDGSEQEVLVLEFDADARLFVPLEQSYLVSRYVGVGRKHPALSSLGNARWSKAKQAAEKAVFDYAARLLAVQAERETLVGHAYPPDTHWQQEFERSFIYRETPDQLAAIAATKTDMEGEQPMDRLICGDVGFGKTEVAIRAAFKAVMGGKQVAMLVPTTVLAQQHFQNFRERMSDYPVRVEMLSRFRKPAEQREVLRQLADGSVDIVIGTHRLISADVQFKNLGLVVIDEEQRFGVLHKEKFKSLFALIDVLTLSATPIPRTLYLSLMGAKDMSTLDTPPANRIPVETTICAYDERVFRDAIEREIARQGQVYFLHNRVHSIERVRDRIRELVPHARVDIGHGQMHEDDLELVMNRFVGGETDVLVSTTIIESGLDIPNANTIIIDRADRFGLADLYQLRGRVGRSQAKAFAYLMLPRDVMTVGEARKRIDAIKQYSSLGAGFKIAMRDLEIRGAGNILGTAQSGHIINVGFDLYCQLLRQAVGRLKGEKVLPRAEVILQIDFVATNEAAYRRAPGEDAPAFLPAAFMAESELRIRAYRDLSQVAATEELEKLRATWRDRFGVLPEPAENLLRLARIKLAAAARKVTRLETREGKLMLTRGGDYILIGGRFPRLSIAPPADRLEEIARLLLQL